MVAALVSMQLLFYLTDVLEISTGELWAVTVILVVMRVFDAVNDPFMGIVVDNTRTRWGKFKPWIALGAVLWGAATVVMFTDWGLHGTAFILVFIVVYLLWEISYTINDISYYGMLPSLTRNQKERERIGVVARICANVGLFAMVAALVPATTWLGSIFGSTQRGWFALAAIAVAIMLVFQSLTLIFTKEEVSKTESVASTPLRELLSVIARNDQLMWATLSMLLFMIGYTTTTAFGLYYFKYIFGDENMYTPFALILGVTQITALAVFPLLSARLKRRQVHTLATALCVAGYAVFLFAGSSMIVVGIAGVLLFAGQGMIQLLMMMFIADSVEYGQWKLGRRNESITFSLQPFIYKLSNAVASGIVGVTLIWSGVKEAAGPADVTGAGAGVFRTSMMILPMALVALSYVIARRYYTLDEDRYRAITAELEADHA